MEIRTLPDFLINQIAAGEVIERPAFIIKELIENAIDAKANEINIIVKDGGKQEIIVSDNGIGMAPDQLKLCVKRHATSKLPKNNLNDIKFLGFRGEALPSIASISELKIESCRKELDEGLVRDALERVKASERPESSEKKRSYNSMENINVTVEDMEAYRLTKISRDDPMANFLQSDELMEYDDKR